jgi:selenocysteine lyase/cysteine desulfurase
MTDWAFYRAEFPALGQQAYLNTAAGAPMSRAASAAAREYYEATARDGDVHWDQWLGQVETVRAAAAQLIGADASEIAFVQNASAAMNLVAARLRGAGDVVLVRGDFPSVTYPWMAGGHTVSFAEPGDSGGASLEAIAAACSPETGIISVGLVHYRTGFRYDLDALSEFCRERDLLLVVDATQGLGAVRVDVAASGVDFMVCSGYKWLTSGYGFGLLYGSRAQLESSRHVAAGWRSARHPYALVSDALDLTDEAAALELGHPPFAAVFGLGAALAMQAEIGAAAIENRVLHLASRLRQVLVDAGLRVTPEDAADLRSGIVYAEADRDAAQLRNALLDQGVYVSARGDGIRCSAHFYNDETDLARLARALEAVL